MGQRDKRAKRQRAKRKRAKRQRAKRQRAKRKRAKRQRQRDKGKSANPAFFLKFLVWSANVVVMVTRTCVLKID